MKRIQGLFPYVDYWVYYEYNKSIDRYTACMLNKTTGKKTSMAWARYIKSVAEKRILHKSEHVDHIDDNPYNDDPSNLQILTQAENNRKYWNSPNAPKPKTTEVVCFYCGKTFIRANRKIRVKRQFCSKRCVGKQVRRFEQPSNLRS